MTVSDAKRAWLKADTARRQQRALAYLGGRCARCGETDNLEFDHIDRTTKIFTISGNLNRRWEILKTELDKCQLLCHECHRRKTVEHGEAGGGWNKGIHGGNIPHGTTSGYTYWKCRCEPCKQKRYEDRIRYGELDGSRGRRPRKPT